MEIVCKKTTELTHKELQQISDCFCSVFKGHKTTADRLLNIYTNTCVGYSLHTLLLNPNRIIVGAYTVVPFEYTYKCNPLLFAIGMGFMIREDYRNDFKNVMSICRESMQFAKDYGISCVLAFPNDLSHLLNIRILRMKDVGKLHTYILPYKVGDAKPKLKALNFGSMLFSWLMLGTSALDFRKTTYSTMFERNRSTFDSTRYKWFNPSDYRFYKEDEMSCSWKVADFEGVKAAFLMDFYPVSSDNFNKAVKAMFNAEKSNVGIFLYVGNLPFATFSMVKIPLKYAPKNFNFVAQVLDKSKVNEKEVLDICNWDINLSSYDLL